METRPEDATEMALHYCALCLSIAFSSRDNPIQFQAHGNRRRSTPIKPTHKPIAAYYAALDKVKAYKATHEGADKRFASSRSTR